MIFQKKCIFDISKKYKLEKNKKNKNKYNKMSQISVIPEGEIKEIKLEKINLYLIGEIGDGSCFYHSICDALITNYQDENIVKNIFNETNVRKARQKYVDNFRRGIANYLMDVDDNNTVENIKLGNMHYLFSKYVRNKNLKIFGNIKKTYTVLDITVPWEIYVFDTFYIENEDFEKENVVSKETGEKITDSSYLQSLSVTFLDKKILLTRKNVNAVLEKLKKNISDKSFDKYLQKIYENINSYDDFLKSTSNKLENIYKFVKSCIVKIKYEFGDGLNYEYGKYKESEIPKDLKNIKKLYLKSVDTNGVQLTEKKYDEFMSRDPREDFDIKKDDVLYKLPLNINYLSMMNYTIIEKVYSENQKSFQLNNLIRTIDSREDAGWNNIITLIPQILKINIHIIEIYKDEMKLYRTVPENWENGYKNIVLRGNGYHFEVVGCMNNGEIQTVFEYDDVLISLIKSLTK